nr:dicarboxylate/amino acid:cation symporter [Clostridia bacterium]
VLGIRLSLEESLLRWLDHFGPKGEEPELEFFAGYRFFRPVIDVRLRGERVDPLLKGDEDGVGDWIQNVFTNIGLSPVYNYQNGINLLRIRLNKPRRNAGFWLLMGIIAGIVLGFAGKAFFSQEVLQTITVNFFDPVQDLFLRLLTATAGPVIFLTVLTSICGIGAAMMNKSGKILIIRFLGLSALITLIFTMAGVIALRPDYTYSTAKSLGFAIFDIFTDFVPGDIVSPFLYTDSPHLILLAIVIGNALLILGSRANLLVKIANQANSVGLLIADWISRLIPFFVAILLAFKIVDGTDVKFLSIWKPLVLFHVYTVILLIIVIYMYAHRFGLTFTGLWQKIRPSFMIALRNASVNAAFSENRLCCEKRLGINSRMVDSSLPLGLVIYMPVSTISLMASTLYALNCYGMTVSVSWMIIAILLVVALQAASPPVSGVDSLAYVAIFAKLGIPSEALIMAIICDIIFCFLSSAANQTLLQMELISEADRLSMLDKKVLNS